MLSSWLRDLRSDLRSSSVWWRFESVERYVEGAKSGARKSLRWRGAG